MSLFGDLLNPETIKGVILIFIIIFIVTGRGGKMVGSIIRKQADRW